MLVQASRASGSIGGVADRLPNGVSDDRPRLAGQDRDHPPIKEGVGESIGPLFWRWG